jgi:hypothetical protein
MDKRYYVIQSNLGYLKDIEEYTNSVSNSVLFVDFDNAIEKLKQVKEYLTQQCWVKQVTITGN